MKLTVLHHNHCFDGFASAAVFSRFFGESVSPGAVVSFGGLSHAPNQTFIDEALLDGDENAIVDFKYCPSPRLTWWFDHHQSAFLSAEDQRHFEQEKSPTKLYDPSYKSCTKFIADVAAEKYGYVQPELDDLVYWADIIDGAQYEDAKTAVELEAPALRVMLVIEASRNVDLMQKIIRMMQLGALPQIAEDPQVKREAEPLFERHLRMVDLIRETADYDGDVVHFDLSGQDAAGYSKFIPYYLYPECVYSVGVSLTANRAKVSVGFNPWSRNPRRHNLASICERYNGGGHAVVGAISYRPDQIELARQTAREIATELRTP